MEFPLIFKKRKKIWRIVESKIIKRFAKKRNGRRKKNIKDIEKGDLLTTTREREPLGYSHWNQEHQERQHSQ